MIVAPWLLLVLRRYMQPMLERSYEEQEAEARIWDVMERTLSALPVVQAFGQETARDRAFARTTDDVVRASVASTIVGLKFKALIGLGTACGTAAIVWLGAQSVLDGRLTAGGILVFLAYLAALYGPLETLMYAPSTTQGAAGSARRVLEILETRREVDDRPGARRVRLSGHVRFEDVTFGYDADRPILHEISLEVRPGETVAIIGHTGAGKSTLAGLVPRFNDPWSGRVTIDGVDLRDIELKSLRSQVAVVLQEPFLLPMSIADNIAYGRPHASRAEIEAAARAANAHGFIARLPEGYDTVLGRARRDAVGRRAPAPVGGPRDSEGCPGADPRRADQRHRFADGSVAAGGAGAADAGTRHHRHRPPDEHDRRGRPHRRARSRPGGRAGHAGRAPRARWRLRALSGAAGGARGPP